MRLGRRIVAGLVLGAVVAYVVSLLRPRRVPAYLAEAPAPAVPSSEPDLSEPQPAEPTDQADPIAAAATDEPAAATDEPAAAPATVDVTGGADPTVPTTPPGKAAG